MDKRIKEGMTKLHYYLTTFDMPALDFNTNIVDRSIEKTDFWGNGEKNRREEIEEKKGQERGEWPVTSIF